MEIRSLNLLNGPLSAKVRGLVEEWAEQHQTARARRSLRTARLDLDGGDADASVNRSYYAAFYAVWAVFEITQDSDFSDVAILRSRVEPRTGTAVSGSAR